MKLKKHICNVTKHVKFVQRKKKEIAIIALYVKMDIIYSIIQIV